MKSRTLHQRSSGVLVPQALGASDISRVKEFLRIVPALYPGGDEWLDRRLSETLAGEAECLLIKDGCSVLGVCIVTPKPRALKISTLLVCSEARGHGVGASLLSRALEIASDKQLQETYITVAHHLAEPLTDWLVPWGFTRTALEMNRYGVGRHECVLTRLGS